MSPNASETKSSFLWKNLLRGFLWFGFLMVVYLTLHDQLNDRLRSFAEAANQTPLLQFIVFGVSELVLGLIPPEFFMIIMILEHISLAGYIQNLVIYTIISYAAGMVAYFAGRRFSVSAGYQRFSARFLRPYEEKIRKYGSYLVFVGAITPVPFSATCLVAGSVRLPVGQFLVASSYRVIRFAVYGWLVWKFPIWFTA